MPPPHTEPRANKVDVGGTWAGWFITSNRKLHCHCEGVRSTLKTLAYDCGNPVQYVCGHSPAVLFYSLDRHAPLAMTKGTKWLIPQSLTTPAASRHPSNGGELSTFPSRSKFPSAEGCREAAGWSNPHSPYCGQHTPVTRTPQCPPPPGPAQTKFAWVWSITRSPGEG